MNLIVQRVGINIDTIKQDIENRKILIGFITTLL